MRSGLPQRPTEALQDAEVRERESYMFECNLILVLLENTKVTPTNN
jgi:hypothetical protein